MEISIHSDLIISLSAQTNIGVECWSLIWSLLSKHSNIKVAGSDYNYVMLQTYHIGHWWHNQNAGRFTDRQRACVCASTKLILIYFCHFLRMSMRRNHNHQQFSSHFPIRISGKLHSTHTIMVPVSTDVVHTKRILHQRLHKMLWQHPFSQLNQTPPPVHQGAEGVTHPWTMGWYIKLWYSTYANCLTYLAAFLGISCILQPNLVLCKSLPKRSSAGYSL